MKGLWATLLIAVATSTPWSAPVDGMEPRAVQQLGRVAAADPRRQPSAGSERVVYRLDFSEFPGGSVVAWLESKGFQLRDAATNPHELELSIVDGALRLETKKQLRGFIYNDSLRLERFSKTRLTWGVTKFPDGASYEKQVRNEALMIYFSFGEEKISSGSLLLPVPDLPYFIGLFLCRTDKIHTPYIGAYYHKGGRFVCLGQPQPNETLLSEFDLVTAFQAYYEKAEVPYLSGITFGVDTSAAGDGGKAEAYVKSIEILD